MKQLEFEFGLAPVHYIRLRTGYAPVCGASVEGQVTSVFLDTTCRVCIYLRLNHVDSRTLEESWASTEDVRKGRHFREVAARILKERHGTDVATQPRPDTIKRADSSPQGDERARVSSAGQSGEAPAPPAVPVGTPQRSGAGSEGASRMSAQTPTSKQTTMRCFTLERREDVTGTSGTGIVAEGVEFSNGQVVIHWISQLESVNVYANVKVLDQLHGHNGRTSIVWGSER